MLLPFAPWTAAARPQTLAPLEERLDDAVARVRGQRPSVAALRASLALIEELQSLAVAAPARYEAVIAPRSAVLPLWLMQLGLVVAAAGLPGQGRALLAALPGVAASALVHDLVEELFGGAAAASARVLGGAA